PAPPRRPPAPPRPASGTAPPPPPPPPAPRRRPPPGSSRLTLRRCEIGSPARGRTRLGPADWQPDRERAAEPGRAVERDGAAMLLGDLTHGGQADAGPLDLRDDAGAAAERREDVTLLLDRD